MCQGEGLDVPRCRDQQLRKAVATDVEDNDVFSSSLPEELATVIVHNGGQPVNRRRSDSQKYKFSL